jgi:hypothetical protein
MPVFLVKGSISATTFPGTNPGDLFTLTVVTDGFSGLCTVANGHLISVTGTIEGTAYDITLTNGYPANPSFNPTTKGLTGQGSLPVGGLVGLSIFTYDPATFTIAGENDGANGVFPAAPGCPKNAQGV